MNAVKRPPASNLVSQARYKRLAEPSDLNQPTTSSLYCLEPYQVGTALTESLTSYMAHLAAAHYVSPNTLVVEGLIPHLTGRDYTRPTATYPDTVYPHGLWTDVKWLNGASQLTHDLVPLLEKLVGRKDLRYSCFLSWAEAIPSRNLTKRYRSWCPACLNEWLAQGIEAVYESLLWNVTLITGCIRHHQPLQQHCPHCGKSSPPLTYKMVAGYCGFCDHWLGQESGRYGIDSDTNNKGVIDWSKLEWVTAGIGELIAAAPGLTQFPTKTWIKPLILQCASIFTANNRTRLRWELDLPGSTLDGWLSEAHTPSLELLLALAARLQTSPLKLLYGKIPAFLQMKLPIFEKASTTPGVVTTSRTSAKAKANQFDLAQAKAALETELNSPELPPRTLGAIATQYGYSLPTLYLYLSQLCRAITQKRREYFLQQKTDRLTKLRQAIYNATTELHHQNI
jgi:hypothetical protein